MWEAKILKFFLLCAFLHLSKFTNLCRFLELKFAFLKGFYILPDVIAALWPKKLYPKEESRFRKLSQESYAENSPLYVKASLWIFRLFSKSKLALRKSFVFFANELLMKKRPYSPLIILFLLRGGKQDIHIDYFYQKWAKCHQKANLSFHFVWFRLQNSRLFYRLFLTIL